MFSQHPDHASKPYWHTEAFIDTLHELKESYLMFKDMGADEIMWDWEGKLVDEAVVEKLLSRYGSFFRENPLGQKLFLTFRIPHNLTLVLGTALKSSQFQPVAKIVFGIYIIQAFCLLGQQDVIK